MLCEERMRELEKGQLWGNLTAAPKYLRECHQDNRARLFRGALKNDERQQA